MSCKYYFKDKLIGNIQDLNTFLLFKFPNYKELGDYVFQLTDDQNTIALHFKVAHDLAQATKITRDIEVDIDGDFHIKYDNDKVIAITKFIQSYIKEDGSVISPYFNKDNYWTNRLKVWSENAKLRKVNADNTVDKENEGFTLEEAVILLGLQNSTLPENELIEYINHHLTTINFDKQYLNNQGTVIYEKLPIQIQNLIKEVEKRWDYQAKLGIAIHNIYATYFKKTNLKKGNEYLYQYEIWENKKGEFDDEAINKSIREYFKNPKAQGYIEDKYLSETQIKEFILKAQELRLSLEQKFLTEDEITMGQHLDYFIEAEVTSNPAVPVTPNEDIIKTLAGRIDLAVVTPKGAVKVFDFKVGNKPYDQYDSAKRLTYVYQLAIYNRILQLLGIQKKDTKDYTFSFEDFIVPIEVKNLAGLKNDKFKFVYNTEDGNIFKNITVDCTNPTVIKEINTILPYEETLSLEDTELQQKHAEKMNFLFDQKISETVEISDEQIKNLITDGGQSEITPNEHGYYSFYFSKARKHIKIKADRPNALKLFIQEVKNEYVSIVQSTQDLSKFVLKQISEAIDKKTQLDPNENSYLGILGDVNLAKLNKYCNGKWHISLQENAKQLFQLYNIIIFESADPIDNSKIIEVVKLERLLPNDPYPGVKTGRNYCDFKFADNVEEDSKEDSLMLKGVVGNINLIEIMLLLHESGYSNAKINNIALMCPYGTKSKYFSATAEEIDYSLKHILYKAQRQQKNNKDHFINQFKLNNNLTITSSTEQLIQLYEDVSADLKEKYFQDYEESFNDIKEGVQNTQECIDKILGVIRKIEEKRPSLKADFENQNRTFEKVLHFDAHDKLALLYLQAHLTLMDLNGFKTRQALKGHTNYMDSLAVLTEGFSGNQVDNAGNFKNYYVNEVSKLIINSVQTIRNKIMSSVQDNGDDIKQLDKELKKNFVISNPNTRFVGMTYKTNDDDVLFINPWAKEPVENIPSNFTEAQFNYLKKVILKINKLRFPNTSSETIIKTLSNGINDNNIQYLQVPLLPPSLASRISEKGFIKTFIDKVKPFTTVSGIQSWWKNLSDKITENDLLTEQESNDIFIVLDSFSKSFSTKERKKLISLLQEKFGKTSFYENNLELLVGLYEQAKATQEAYRDVMPVIKGASLYLQQQGINLKEDFKSDLQTIDELVKRNINNLSLGSTIEKKISKVTGNLTKLASYLTLAFNPVQYTGQKLDGIVKLAKLSYIVKGQEEAPFTEKELRRAFAIVEASITKGTDVSLIDQLNILFGVNDMDIDQYINNMKQSKNFSLFNFDRAAFYTTSRPDFYNRMTLFIAQLIHQGSFDAFYLDENNRIKYDCKKDLRFKALWDGSSKDSVEYKKALQQYIATVQQLNKEGAKIIINLNEPKIIHQGYSNQEVESLKALGDMLYGYYDSSKRSLALSKWAGGLVGQMKTYISSKKNMYLGFKGKKNQYYWDKVTKDTDPSVYLTYAKNEDGSININKLVWSNEEDASDIIFLKLKGQITAGIFNTLWELAMNENISLSSKIFHPEKSLRQLCTRPDGTFDSKLYYSYIFNFRMFVGDLFATLLLGLLTLLLTGAAKDASKEAKEKPTFSKATEAIAWDFVAKTVFYAQGDSNVVSSLFAPFSDWNPFCFGQASKLAYTSMQVLSGDKDILTAIGNTTAVGKLFIKPWHKTEPGFMSEVLGNES